MKFTEYRTKLQKYQEKKIRKTEGEKDITKDHMERKQFEKKHLSILSVVFIIYQTGRK